MILLGLKSVDRTSEQSYLFLEDKLSKNGVCYYLGFKGGKNSNSTQTSLLDPDILDPWSANYTGAWHCSVIGICYSVCCQNSFSDEKYTLSIRNLFLVDIDWTRFPFFHGCVSPPTEYAVSEDSLFGGLQHPMERDRCISSTRTNLV